MIGIRLLEVKTYIEILMGANTVKKSQINTTNQINRLTPYKSVNGVWISDKTLHEPWRNGIFYIYQIFPLEKVREVLIDKLDMMYNKMHGYLTTEWLENIKNRIDEELKNRFAT